eukprot:6207995-Alexandrium_andersonii.AAC.1
MPGLPDGFDLFSQETIRDRIAATRGDRATEPPQSDPPQSEPPQSNPPQSELPQSVPPAEEEW